MDNAGSDYNPSTGITPAKGHVGYKTYISPYGPKYKVQPNIMGLTAKQATRIGLGLAPFAGVAGFFALFFFSDVPKVRNDIWVKVPIVGEHFRKEIPPSDNPF